MKRIYFLLLAWIIAGGALAQKKTWDTIPNLPDHYRAKIAQFDKEPVVKDKILFLGNSITEGGNWKKLLKDSSVINRGISGDITFGVLRRLPEVIRRQPSRIFLLIGINDISKNIPDEVIIENIFSAVRKIKQGSPKTKIYLQSILPTNPTFKTFPANYNKDDHVITINEQLSKYGDRLGYTYVDLYSKFIDKDHRLNAPFSTDGLHLSEAGYQNWLSILKAAGFL